MTQCSFLRQLEHVEGVGDVLESRGRCGRGGRRGKGLKAKDGSISKRLTREEKVKT